MFIDGKAIAEHIYSTVSRRVAALPFQPIFCDVLVGNDSASRQYVQLKKRIAEKVGMRFLSAEYPESISGSALAAEVRRLCTTPDLCGLIVQLPLPETVSKLEVLSAIQSDLDVDCLSQKNVGLFYQGRLSFVPPTPAAVLAVLDSVLRSDEQQRVCAVIGQGELVGRPVSYLLEARGWTVFRVTKDVQDPENIVRQADIVITATGVPKLVTASWVKPGAVVIDAGTAENEGSIVGDVDSSVADVASYISPTPGGVGPVTVAKLLENVLRVAELKVVK
jgi:methylenetetrahydrofolate dehydrogenase (NADP+)/methenyltetrahydrofolate cyclohydrolase